ncbi:type IV secretion system DNA-binding domain-containing protein [Brucella tritici]|uniref:Type IV secretion system DNA-binding domain-containing protein n=1 Tax=Brucella tritici TaxID=94626 RepID=A0A6L3YBJ2_9HYPH|nr:type IV secretion system DNA-binding domain-containing protein [Brucella tritici]KAB2678065.1 type IV secretion system DNA-binding domain-containing protein [Brucella tritici]
MTVINHDINEPLHKKPSRFRKTLDYFLGLHQVKMSEQNNKRLEKFYTHVDQVAARTLVNQSDDGKKTIRAPEDYLLNGELEKYAQARFGDTAPYLWLNLPIDALSVPVVNGRLPDVNRSAPGELGFKDFHLEDEEALFEAADRAGRLAWKKMFATTSSIAIIVSVAVISKNFSWPSYTEIQYGMYLDPITRAIGEAFNFTAFLVKLAMEGGHAAISGLITAVGGIGVAFLASNLAQKIAFTNAINEMLPRLKRDLTEKYSQPTRQGRYLYKNNTVDYLNQIENYTRMAYQLVGRLKNQPFVGIGKSTGRLEERGKPFAPRAGVIVGPDFEGLRQHMLVMGFTGSRKTTLGITPISIEFLKSAQKTGQKAGIIVFDGKGILATSIRAAMPKELRGTYITYSTQDGGVGLDLLKHLTPPQIGQVFVGQAFKRAGGKDVGGKWINGAGSNVQQAAEILRYAAAHPQFLKEIWGAREYTYYSLLGILALATEDLLRDTVVRRILEVAQQDPTVFPSDVIESARGLEKLGSLAPETKTSYTSNIQDVIGIIAGTGNLARRFASGEIKGETFQSIDCIFNGGMVGVAISPADEQEGGLLIANLIKTIVYTMAQQRDSASSRAREELLRIDDYVNGMFGELQETYKKLTQVKNLLRKPETRDQANTLMNSMYPASEITGDWDTLKLNVFEYIVEEKITAVKIDSARYTKDIRRHGLELQKVKKEEQELREKYLSEGKDPTSIEKSTTPHIDALIKTRDQTQESSLLCVIDEFHAYATSEGGITADTFFLSIARSTGTTVFAAVQTIDALTHAIGETATNTLLSNFVNKLFFKTNNEASKKYAQEQSGMGIYDRMWVPNAWSTFPALINELGISKPKLVFNRFKRGLFGSLNLKGGIVSNNSIATPFNDFDLGYRDQVDAAQREDDEAGAQNETHNRQVSRMDYIEKADKEFTEKPYMTADEIGNLGQNHAFAIWLRGGRVMMEELDMTMHSS